MTNCVGSLHLVMDYKEMRKEVTEEKGEKEERHRLSYVICTTDLMQTIAITSTLVALKSPVDHKVYEQLNHTE